jgi:regulator of sigma E protease
LLSTLPMTIFAFLITLGLVVVIHELGHFLFCKLFGVYVKTFSIGIGPKMVRKQWGETEYVLSLIPFGGYVKMAGEGLMEEIQDTGTMEERKYPMGTTEGNQEVAGLDDDIPEERQFFTRPAWQRMLIFVAGPLFNLILAFVLFTGLFLVNGREIRPVTTLGAVLDDSPGNVAGLLVGDTITAVDGVSVETWDGIFDLMIPEDLRETGSTPEVTLQVSREGRNLDLSIQPVFDVEEGYWSVGLEPWNTMVGLVQSGSPAARLGLKTGDNITMVNGEKVTTFSQIAAIINDSPGEDVTMGWEHEGVPMTGVVVPELKTIEPGKSVGRIFFEPYRSNVRVGLGEAITLGYRNTSYVIQMTVGSLRQFVEGKLGIQAVGGPIQIGQVAGEYLRWSFSRLLQFIAFFSVNLFLLNLMPIPVLDGGHVLFLIFEILRGGKPVPERLQAIATQIGLIILLLFMTFVIVLDVWRVTGH